MALVALCAENHLVSNEVVIVRHIIEQKKRNRAGEGSEDQRMH